MLYNPSLHDELIDRNYKKDLLDLTQPFGGIHIPHVDFLQFDISDTMAYLLDSMDQGLQPVTIHGIPDIDPYDFLLCDIECTKLLRGHPFPS